MTQRQHCRHAWLLPSKTAQPHKDGLLPRCAGLPTRKWRKWARRWMACHAVAIAQRDARVQLPQAWGTGWKVKPCRALHNQLPDSVPSAESPTRRGSAQLMIEAAGASAYSSRASRLQRGRCSSFYTGRTLRTFRQCVGLSKTNFARGASPLMVGSPPSAPASKCSRRRDDTASIPERGGGG